MKVGIAIGKKDELWDVINWLEKNGINQWNFRPFGNKLMIQIGESDYNEIESSFPFKHLSPYSDRKIFEYEEGYKYKGGTKV